MGNTDKEQETGAEDRSAPVSDSSDSLLIDHPPVLKLLAVDCGLRTGLALFELTGKLLWYRSHNLGNRQRLKKVAWKILREIDGLDQLVIEGGGTLADIWLKEGEKCCLQVQVVQAEQWRRGLLLPRQQRTGKQAKQVADELAREIIELSGTARPTSLRHDTAEAILVGWWAIRCDIRD